MKEVKKQDNDMVQVEKHKEFDKVTKCTPNT